MALSFDSSAQAKRVEHPETGLRRTRAVGSAARRWKMHRQENEESGEQLRTSRNSCDRLGMDRVNGEGQPSQNGREQRAANSAYRVQTPGATRRRGVRC